ncbi:UNVERIFIED_CONTAM: hypothetical protein FKN15_024280 [Acipenser sinensis]
MVSPQTSIIGGVFRASALNTHPKLPSLSLSSPSMAPEGWRPQTPFSAQQLQYWHACTWVLTTLQKAWDLLPFESQEAALAHTAVVTEHLVRLGLTINDAKSRLTPVQCTTYLGHRLDSTTMRSYLSDDRVEAIQGCRSLFRQGSQWRSIRTCTEPSQVGCASGEAPVPYRALTGWIASGKASVPYRAITGRVCQWRSIRTVPSPHGSDSQWKSIRTVPSPHGSGVPVEKHPYRTEPSRVRCASGEASVPYRALTGRVCQWRSIRTVPSPHGSGVPVEKHPYRTEPSRVGCASGEGSL